MDYCSMITMQKKNKKKQPYASYTARARAAQRAIYLEYGIILNFHAISWHVFHMVQIGHSLKRFCCHLFLNTNNSSLVFTMAPLCFDHCCKPSRHAFNQFLTLLSWNLLPELLDYVPKFANTTCRFSSLLLR